MGSSNLTIICNECGRELAIKNIKEEKLSAGTVLQYFTCDYCGKRYKTVIMDAYLKKMIARHESREKKQKYESKLERKYKKQIERFLGKRGKE